MFFKPHPKSSPFPGLGGLMKMDLIEKRFMEQVNIGLTSITKYGQCVEIRN